MAIYSSFRAVSAGQRTVDISNSGIANWLQPQMHFKNRNQIIEFRMFSVLIIFVSTEEKEHLREVRREVLSLLTFKNGGEGYVQLN